MLFKLVIFAYSNFSNLLTNFLYSEKLTVNFENILFSYKICLLLSFERVINKQNIINTAK